MTCGDATWTTSDVGGLIERDRTHGWGTIVVAAAALAFYTGAPIFPDAPITRSMITAGGID